MNDRVIKSKELLTDNFKYGIKIDEIENLELGVILKSILLVIKFITFQCNITQESNG